MKRFTEVWLFIGVAVLLNTAPVFAKGNPWELRLPFEKAVIHYDISGSQKGTETLYIRDFGNERVKITKSKGKVMFVTTTTNTIEIITRDSVINIDMDKKTGTRMTNPQKFMKEEMGKLSAKERAVVMKNFETMGMNMAVQMGGEVKLKGGEHLGYTCDLVTMMGTTSCQMSNTPIVLKIESSLMGISMNTVANKVDRNASVPADVFQLPDNVNVKYDKEADDMSRAMMTSMIESMKDPNAAKNLEEGMARNRTQMEETQQQEMRESEGDPDRDAEKRSDEPSGEEINKMMQEGMKSLKGLFN